ncbi:hypothetical protein WJX75_003021 [Coccomyxa subellipsoidea]|uniref:Uncharacterized protein n=1 Tax=Coccomyxa subellipsoidea TaxID=248742 RepID=A0ABR2YKL0_9CHLO
MRLKKRALMSTEDRRVCFLLRGDGLSLPSLPRLQDYIQDLDDEAYEGVLWGLAGAAHSKIVIRGRTTLSLLYRILWQLMKNGLPQ